MVKELSEVSVPRAEEILSERVLAAYDYLSLRDIHKIDERLFLTFKEYVEDLKEVITKSNLPIPVKNELRDYIFTIKMGAKVPIDTFCHESSLRLFCDMNFLDQIFFQLKHTLKYDQHGFIYLPFELKRDSVSWIRFSDLEFKKTNSGYDVYFEKQLMFQTDQNFMLTDDFTVLMFGITKYNRFLSADFRPYRYQDPSIYNYQNLLDIIVTWRNDGKDSYFFQTHVSMELKGKDGFIRSFGQDIFDHVFTLPAYGYLRAAAGNTIISTPDLSSVYPKHHRFTKRVSIPVTQKEFDQIIALVESDKYNSQRVANLIKGNCVSYTCRVLNKVLRMNIEADVSGFEIMARNLLPKGATKYIVKVRKAFQIFPKWMQKALYFFPPIYIFYLLAGVVTYSMSFNGYKNYRQYSVTDHLIRPWKIRCDIPRILVEVLESYVGSDHVLNRSDYGAGFVYN